MPITGRATGLPIRVRLRGSSLTSFALPANLPLFFPARTARSRSVTAALDHQRQRIDLGAFISAIMVLLYLSDLCSGHLAISQVAHKIRALGPPDSRVALSVAALGWLHLDTILLVGAHAVVVVLPPGTVLLVQSINQMETSVVRTSDQRPENAAPGDHERRPDEDYVGEPVVGRRGDGRRHWPVGTSVGPGTWDYQVIIVGAVASGRSRCKS